MEKHVVRLTDEERKTLSDMISKGRGAATVLQKARILLKADISNEGPGWTDEVIRDALDTSLATIFRTRKAFVEQGFDASLYRKRPEGRQFRKLDGVQEAHLIAIACSQPPEGRSRWTLKLLSSRLVELEVVESISPECVRSTLKKTNSSLG